jgi:hypothetical protein
VFGSYAPQNSCHALDATSRTAKGGMSMKAVMIANTIIMSTYAICVTFASIHFYDPKILWWYLMLGVIGFTTTERKKD